MVHLIDPEYVIYWVFAVAAFFVFLILLIVFLLFLKRIASDLKYINGRIKSSWGAERKHWIKERRRLFLSIFIRR